VEGLLVALIVQKKGDATVSVGRKVLAAFICIATVSLGYFALSALFISTVSVAAAEIPGNIAQSAVGFALGLVVSAAVKRAYPPVSSLTW
jgi:uncharacterized membrane protein